MDERNGARLEQTGFNFQRSRRSVRQNCSAECALRVIAELSVRRAPGDWPFMEGAGRAQLACAAKSGSAAGRVPAPRKNPLQVIESKAAAWKAASGDKIPARAQARPTRAKLSGIIGA